MFCLYGVQNIKANQHAGMLQGVEMHRRAHPKPTKK